MKKKRIPLENVIIFASGPSLCHQDVDICIKSGWDIIAVNNTWQIVPECDVIYAGDYSWWCANFNSISSTAHLWTSSSIAANRFGINLHKMRLGNLNSGLRSIFFALQQGARNILLLGFDCSVSNGVHWHGSHTSPLANPGKKETDRWKVQYENICDSLSNVNIVNCSRYSELKTFKCMNLSDALSIYPGSGPDRTLLKKWN